MVSQSTFFILQDWNLLPNQNEKQEVMSLTLLLQNLKINPKIW